MSAPPRERRDGKRRRGRLAAALTAVSALLLGLFAATPAQAQPTPGTWYVIQSRLSGKVLDVESGATGNGAGLVQWSRTGAADQQFRFLDAGDGFYRIQARHSGKVLDVYEWNPGDGARIVQWTDLGAENQQWRLEGTGDGAYRFVNRFSGKALDVWEWSTADGARISQYTPHDGANQQFGLVPVDGGGDGDPTGDALYVAPGGTDGAPGTESDPTTLASAIDRVSSGGTIYLRGGTYRHARTITIEPGNDGSPGDRTELAAYPGETPVLNFSAQSEDSANRGLRVNGDHWHVRGIVVEHAGDNGIFVGGSGNVIERTVTRYNRDSGLQLSRIASDTPESDWPANNLVLSAVSHDNVDSDGEDADGFAPKLTVGPGNVFRHTVAHNNIDDGYDLYTKSETGPIGEVTVENSLAYRNGTLSDGSQAGEGDRNGYKLGGEDIPVDHVVRNSIAYDNGKHGFTYNRNTGTMTVSGNAAIGNEERNFNFDGGSSVFRNNTSCDSGSNDRIIGSADGSNQFWSGSNGSRCSSYSGSLEWHFASDGRLVVTFGGDQVLP
ncbi:RICIN domain-containing protein [Actinomadura sp. WMMB 499]|uniref:RICIN domain-containing protein n=1 Tax=Actinomadura sp. WMMB 499 TaxID=1219491 RepID=UPI001247AE20|nr:RICIN domain-containing protein [Actinomadura sp. WMMB 499]QFG23240.1 cellulose-binding protein [Actinomadura sp. WMMB 499]